MEEMQSFNESFGLTFSHVINRITTADMSRHKFENTRYALKKTVAGVKSEEDIAYLRRDMAMDKTTMKKIIEKHPDQEERKQATVHLKWLEDEYSKMLTARLSEIKKDK